MLSTEFTTLAGCSVPVQPAGMGGVALPEPGAAVTQAGGLGMLGGVRLPAPFLTNALDRLNRQTPGPLGVNFLDRECLEVAATKTHGVELFYGDADPPLVRTFRVIV